MERWIAWVNGEGELEGEARPYTGFDDIGSATVVHSEEVHYRGVGRDAEHAIELARREWESAQDSE